MAVMLFLQSIEMLATFSVLYVTWLALYRLKFHPLAQFPGPKLAALTGWYESWYDASWAHTGQYTPRIKHMHQQYGPIVRTGPNSVNINDIDFWETIYAPANRKRHRKWNFQWATGSPNSVFSTISHDLHRKRRGALNPFFSKRAINSLEDVIKEKVEKLCHRYEDATGKPDGERGIIRADTAYAALTADVITEYSFGKSSDFLDMPDFNQQWKDAMTNAFISILAFQNFTWFSWFATSMPQWMARKIDPTTDGYFQVVNNVVKQVKEIMAEGHGEKLKEGQGRKTVFHELRDSDLPPEERTFQRLVEDGILLLGAGTETTSRTLYVITYYLLSQKETLARLREDLRTVIAKSRPTLPSLPELENLDYLRAVILEGIRMHGGSCIPLLRTAPNETLRYKEWAMPPGTEVSEIPCLFSFDEKLFPEPNEFRPERWLEMDGQTRYEKHKFSFGTGPRNCLGMNLAWAELDFAVAAIFSRFDMELVDTKVDDIECHIYSAGPLPRRDAKGVRIRVKRTRDV